MKPIDIAINAALIKKAVADALPSAIDKHGHKTLADMAITIKGDKGDKGDQGQPGKDGKDGVSVKGDKGDPGKDGKDGVSLKGDKGDPGKDGASVKGERGKDGKNGVGIRDCWIDPDNGRLYVELTDGRVVDCGIAKGEDGEKGEPGPRGYSGVMVGGGGGSNTGGGTGSGGPVNWGSIGGSIDDQLDLIAALAEKQDAVDAFSGSWDDLEDVPIALADTTAAFTTAQEAKLAGVADGATANATDAALRDRSTHTGTQAQSSITNLVSDLAAKAPLAGATLTGASVNGVTLTTAGGTTNFLRADGTYAAPPGGGGVLSGSAIITVAKGYEDSEVIAATGVTPSSRVQVWLAPSLDSDENDPEMLGHVSLWAIPDSDQITVNITFSEPTSGPVKIQWSAV